MLELEEAAINADTQCIVHTLYYFDHVLIIIQWPCFDT